MRTWLSFYQEPRRLIPAYYALTLVNSGTGDVRRCGDFLSPAASVILWQVLREHQRDETSALGKHQPYRTDLHILGLVLRLVIVNSFGPNLFLVDGALLI